MRKPFTKSLALTFALFGAITTNAQTFFETAEGDGIITFRTQSISQIKLNLSSTSLTYGYYYTSNSARVHNSGVILNAEISVTPNENGFASIIKNGGLQPGFAVKGAFGYRWNNPTGTWSVVDVYVKPEYSLNELSIYDSIRIASGAEPFYKTTKGSFGATIILNYGSSVGANANIFVGLSSGVNFTNNVDDLEDVTVQKLSPYPGNSNLTVASDIKTGKAGTLENLTKISLGTDIVFDPGWSIGTTGATTKLALFGYFRGDPGTNLYRSGVGFCLVEPQNPSKVFTSIGYQIPQYGGGVSATDRKNDAGTFFATLGLSF